MHAITYLYRAEFCLTDFNFHIALLLLRTNVARWSKKPADVLLEKKRQMFLAAYLGESTVIMRKTKIS